MSRGVRDVFQRTLIILQQTHATFTKYPFQMESYVVKLMQKALFHLYFEGSLVTSSYAGSYIISLQS